MFELFQGLPNCNTQTENEHMLLENGTDRLA